MKDREFDDLVNAWLDGAADESQLAKLEAQLLDHPEAQAQFWELASLHGLVYTLAKQKRIAAPLPTGATAVDVPPRGSASRPESPVLGFLGAAVNLSVAWFSSPKALALTVVGGLLTYFVGLVISIAISRAAAPRDARSVAQTPAESRTGAQPSLAKDRTGIGSLAGDDRARWSKETPPAEGAVRIGQRYELLSGRVDVALARGAPVVIDGPATWLLESEQRLRFDSGKLAARVPKSAIGFTVATPLAEVVDLGTEFGVEVDGGGKTEVHVLKGEVEVKQVPTEPTAVIGPTRVVAGQAVRVVAAGEQPERIPVDRPAFAGALQQAAAPQARPDDQRVTKIWLGNLFDDHPHVPLADAMRTDTFKAAADFNDLGVNRTFYGGDPVKEIAPGLRFDLTSLGWQNQSWAHIANDANSDDDQNGPIGGIRITGKRGPRVARLDEGIGTEANSLVTFALDEIRAAGNLGNRDLVFVCDRAGLDDTSVGYPSASVHMAVIISSEAAVRSAFVDGTAAKLSEREKCWSVVSPMGEPIRGDGRFFSVRQSLAAEVKYLTLVSASAGDESSHNRAVWIGARLEVAP